MPANFANNAQSTLSGAITATATSCTVASAASFPTAVPFKIQIDNELINVLAVAGAIFTLQRAQEGTTGAAHSSGAVVTAPVTAAELKNNARPAYVGTATPSGGVSGDLAVGSGYLWANDAGTWKRTPLSVATIPWTYASLQAGIDATPTNGTLYVPAQIFRESVTVSRAMTIVGAGVGATIIDGRDTGGTRVRDRWMTVSASDVTVRGFTMQYTTGGYSTQYSVAGIIMTSGAQRFTLQDSDLSYSWVNLGIIAGNGSIINNVGVHHADHLGIRAGAFPSPSAAATGQQIINCHVYQNMTNATDPDADGGNIKVTNSSGIIISGNEVDHAKLGIWLDVVCQNSVINANRVHDHDEAGIFDETSTGSKIYDNVCWNNGYGPTGTAWWGAAISVASSKNAEVYNNTCAWNRNGISVSSQNRSDNAGSTGHYVHDNTVIMELPTSTEARVGLWFVQDWASTMYTDSNTGLNNKFWYPDTTTFPNRFYWSSQINLTAFAATPGGAGSTYMTTAAKDAALAAAGL